MTITVNNDDLLTLRRLLHEKHKELQAAPVLLTRGDNWKGVRAGLRKDMAVLAKTIRKLNRAMKVVYGHECNAGGFYSI